MKSLVFILLIAVLTFSPALVPAKDMAKKTVVLKEITNPDVLFADENQLYVPQGASIFIYSLKDYKLVKSFGKAGEGPQEFKVPPNFGYPLIIDAQTENLIITSLGRLSYFSKKGDFVRQENLPPQIRSGAMIQPLGKNYFFLTYARDENKTVYTTIQMAGLQFDNQKEIFRVKHYMQPGAKIRPVRQAMNFQTDFKCNHLVLDSTDGKLHVFGPDGKKKTTISPELKPVPVSAADKKSILNFFQTDPRLKPMWPRLKDRIEIDGHFRLIQFTNIADCKIYVSTYEKKDGKTLHLVYDKNGKLLQKVYLPMKFRSPTLAFPMAFKNDTFYQLVDNEKTENWELHITPIK